MQIFSDHRITHVNNEICRPIRWENKRMGYGISGAGSHMERISGHFDWQMLLGGGQSEGRGGYIQGNTCRLLTAAIMMLSLMAVAFECL